MKHTWHTERKLTIKYHKPLISFQFRDVRSIDITISKTISLYLCEYMCVVHPSISIQSVPIGKYKSFLVTHNTVGQYIQQTTRANDTMMMMMIVISLFTLAPHPPALSSSHHTLIHLISVCIYHIYKYSETFFSISLSPPFAVISHLPFAPSSLLPERKRDFHFNKRSDYKKNMPLSQYTYVPEYHNDHNKNRHTQR